LHISGPISENVGGKVKNFSDRNAKGRCPKLVARRRAFGPFQAHKGKLSFLQKKNKKCTNFDADAA